MNKRQLIMLWIIGIVISIIALITAVSWQHIKYPFHFFITASLPALIIGSLLYYTISKVEHPLRWFHWGRKTLLGWFHRRRKTLLIILILLSATFACFLALVAVYNVIGERQRERIMRAAGEVQIKRSPLRIKPVGKAYYRYRGVNRRWSRWVEIGEKEYVIAPVSETVAVRAIELVRKLGSIADIDSLVVFGLFHENIEHFFKDQIRQKRKPFIIGWEVNKIDERTYLVSYTYNAGSRERGWLFEVDIVDEIVWQIATKDLSWPWSRLLSRLSSIGKGQEEI